MNVFRERCQTAGTFGWFRLIAAVVATLLLLGTRSSSIRPIAISSSRGRRIHQHGAAAARTSLQLIRRHKESTASELLVSDIHSHIGIIVYCCVFFGSEMAMRGMIVHQDGVVITVFDAATGHHETCCLTRWKALLNAS